MCFTPIVSLSTAIFEFAVATFILLYYKKSKINKTILLFIYMLGLYQFTEYMLCISKSPALWAKIGFITYTFLPAVGLKFCIDYVKKKYNTLLIFVPPIAFSVLAILSKNFIIESSCAKYFVIIRNLFSSNSILMSAYVIYYLGFILFISYLLICHYKKQKNILKKKMDIDVLIAIFASLVPALILLFILPSLSLQIGSIYCQFAVIFAVCALAIFHLEKKLRRK